MTRVLVCGGRDFNNLKHLTFLLDQMHSQTPFTCIIHGNASGADRMAGAWANLRGIPVESYPADWETHGKAAGPVRNLYMLAKSKPHLVIAFPGGRGTLHMVRIAKASGIQVVEVGELFLA